MKIIFYFIFIFLGIFNLPVYAKLNIVSHVEVFQGKSFIVFILNSLEVSNAVCVFNNNKYSFYNYENGLRAIIPTTPDDRFGECSFEVKAKNKNGEQEYFSGSIIISRLKYPVVSFYLKPAKKKLLNKDLIQDEWLKIEEKITKESPLKLWEGKFIKPVDGATTMVFGSREFVNGKPRSYHKGWDFRAKIGTPVKSTNNGVVVFSDFLKAFGNTIVIDHGQGINTLYFHLSKINVKQGEFVLKGDIIGLTGNTGISSGPHLHWGMSVHNVRVEPRQWTLTVMP